MHVRYLLMRVSVRREIVNDLLTRELLSQCCAAKEARLSGMRHDSTRCTVITVGFIQHSQPTFAFALMRLSAYVDVTLVTDLRFRRGAISAPVQYDEYDGQHSCKIIYTGQRVLQFTQHH